MEDSNKNDDKTYNDLLDDISNNSLYAVLYVKSLIETLRSMHNIDGEVQPLIQQSFNERLSIEEKINQAYRLVYDTNLQLNVLAAHMAIIYEKVTGLPEKYFTEMYAKSCTIHATNVILGKAAL